MPRRRNRNDGFEPAVGWTIEEENTLFNVLYEYARSIRVSNPVIWDDSLGNITATLTYGFKKMFNVSKVKRKVQSFRDDYEEFVRYIQTPGVDYDVRRNVVRVDDIYWNHIGHVSV